MVLVLVRVVETDSVAERDHDAGWAKKKKLGGASGNRIRDLSQFRHMGLRVLFCFAQERKE